MADTMPSGSALVLLPILWVAIAVGWSPLLLWGRLRAVFADWPTGSLAGNYLLAVLAVGAVHVGLFLAGGVVLFGAGDPGLLAYALALNLAVPVVGWVLVCVVGPWLRDEAVPHTAAFPLLLGAVWYAVVTTGVLALLALVLFVAFYPG